MKNIHTILSDLGITVPEDKIADLNKEVAANYKTIAEHGKVADKLKAAEDALKGFEGIDPKDLQSKLDAANQKLKDMEESHRKEAAEREFTEELTAAIKAAKGKNPKAITALLDTAALKDSKNRDKDIKAALEAVKGENDYLFDADDGGTPPAKFTGPRKDGGNGGGGKLTKKDIMAERDSVKRQKLILENSHLFT